MKRKKYAFTAEIARAGESQGSKGIGFLRISKVVVISGIGHQAPE